MMLLKDRLYRGIDRKTYRSQSLGNSNSSHLHIFPTFSVDEGEALRLRFERRGRFEGISLPENFYSQIRIVEDYYWVIHLEKGLIKLEVLRLIKELGDFYGFWS